MKTITLFNFKPVYLILILDLILTILVYLAVSKRTQYDTVFDKVTVVDFKVIKFDSISSKGVVLRNLKTGRETRRTDKAIVSIAEGRDTISLQTDLKDALTLDEKNKLWSDKIPSRGTWIYFIGYVILASVIIGMIDEDEYLPFAFIRGIILVFIGLGIGFFV